MTNEKQPLSELFEILKTQRFDYYEIYDFKSICLYNDLPDNFTLDKLEPLNRTEICRDIRFGVMSDYPVIIEFALRLPEEQTEEEKKLHSYCKTYAMQLGHSNAEGGEGSWESNSITRHSAIVHELLEKEKEYKPELLDYILELAEKEEHKNE